MKRIVSFFIVAILCFLMCSVCYADAYSVMREPVYNMADSFYSNITKVSRNSAWAICDTNGYPLTGYNWEAMGEIVDEYIPARHDGRWGYISPEGKVLISYDYQQADNFSEGLARVLTEDNKYAYINKTGEIAFVSPFEYSFSVSGGAVCGVQNGLYGYCDTAGSIIIQPQFELGFDFHDGLAAVKSGDKWGYISTDGSYIIKPAYTHASDFQNGYAVCATSSGYGIVDRYGKKTSAFSFNYIGKMDSSGRFPAKSGEKCGYINAKGEWLMTLDYDFCYTFTDGVARVFKDGLWGYINEQGEEIVAPVFVDCSEYRNSRAFYSLDGVTYGFLTLDIQGTNVAPQPQTPPESPDSTETTQKTPQYAPPADNDDNAVIIDPSQYADLPAPVYEKDCISMKIGNTYARKNSDVRQLSHTPELVDGVTMVPLRDVVEYIGGTVGWDEKNKRITIVCNGYRASLTLGSKICYVNGVATVIASPPQLIDDVTMIPVRSVGVAFGCKVEWVADTQNIFIRY